MHYHSIKITGNLIIESKQKSFRRAISEYLAKPDEEGVQLKITDIDDEKRPSEDIVVTMKLISMKQNPQDHCFKQSGKLVKPLTGKINGSTASDVEFY